MISTHDKIIKSLEDKLISSNRTVLSEYEYRFKGQHEADIILIGPSNNYAYAIEVKTTDKKKTRKKAHSQLRYDRDFIAKTLKIERIFLFYAHGGWSRNTSYTISRYIPQQ